jgi:adenylylsulfate kinase-like enzyme
MKVSYDKDQRTKAKEENKRLFTVSFTGLKGGGQSTLQGLCGDKGAEIMLKAFTDMLNLKE